jgi:hypothetical protein
MESKKIILRQSLKPFFSKIPSDLKTPNQIEGTDIYAEVNLNPGSILRLSKK